MSTPVESDAQLVAHTVPSTWICAEFVDPTTKGWDAKTIYRTNEPFRRIVSLVTPGNVLTTPADHARYDSEHEYEAGDTQAEALPFEGVLAERLVGFFDKYLSGKPRTADSILNCHRLGAWMRGVTTDSPGLNGFIHKALPESYISRGERTQRNLALGEVGVIGHMKHGDLPRPLHTVIGLGEDRDECLQVMWTNGYLGIDRYDHQMELYTKNNGGRLRRLRGVVDLGLYTLPRRDPVAATEGLVKAA